MSAEVDDRKLWEWVDDASPELEAHLEHHPQDRERVDELRNLLAAFRKSPGEVHRARPERVGRYRLLRRIGRGGMGVVYEAEQDAPRRRVAVKMLCDASFEDAQVRARFVREAEALGRLAHPNVAIIFEHGESFDGEPFLAMELVDGVALDVWARERRARRREIVELLEKVARAVHHAHERGIVHRDLKPSNVLVDARGEPRVLDFGLARIGDDAAAQKLALTTTGRIFGTLAYMSPEQAKGASEIGSPADTYALGVILYEALSGVLPYDLSARSLPEAARVIAEESPRRLRDVVGGVAADLDVICGKALEKVPSRRFESATEFADDLRRWLDGQPIHARRSSLTYRALRFVRRHAMELGAALLIAALGLFGFYASASRIDLGALQDITGDWYDVASPFDGLRWEGERPVVRVDGTWYDLFEIEGLRAGFIVGFCQQNAGELWRKRFREDLLQVLNRMGVWPMGSVDMVVRDRETGDVRTLLDVECSTVKRQVLRSRIGDWYFDKWAWTADGLEVEHGGRRWKLESIDTLSVDELRRGAMQVATTLSRVDRADQLESAFLQASGRSPNETVELVLIDLTTLERVVIPRAERTYRNASSAPTIVSPPLPLGAGSR